MTEIKDKADLKFYTTNEIADLLKMNIQVIARKLKHGELPGYKIEQRSARAVIFERAQVVAEPIFVSKQVSMDCR